MRACVPSDSHSESTSELRDHGQISYRTITDGGPLLNGMPEVIWSFEDVVSHQTLTSLARDISLVPRLVRVVNC